jgi:plastocyanin
MKLKYLFVLLTILLVIGCTTKKEVTKEATQETPATEETPSTLEEPKMEAAVSSPTEQVILIKGPKAVEPSELTVSVGTLVTWKNVDYLDVDKGTGRAHTIAEWNDYFRSERLESGDSFSFTFTEPGTYEYRSITAPGAKGTIIVE